MSKISFIIGANRFCTRLTYVFYFLNSRFTSDYRVNANINLYRLNFMSACIVHVGNVHENVVAAEHS